MALHPRLTSVDGSRTSWLAEIGNGSWGDLSWITRYGDGPCGMFEASWTMPLPADFAHPLLQRGTVVELMDGPYRVGSSLILNEPARGDRLGEPWRLVASGVGREVEGENSYYALDSSGNSTDSCATAVTEAIARGWPVDGADATVTGAASTFVPTDELVTVGALLGMTGDRDGTRWGVNRDNVVTFLTDPTEPTYHLSPSVPAPSVADDDYATVVLVRYVDSTTHAAATVTAPASVSAIETRYGHREYPVNLLDRPEMAAANAQARADGILALAKGRLGWAQGLTVTSGELLTSGGKSANLSQVAEEVGDGVMVRLHGVYDDLLDEPHLDLIIGEAKYTDDSDVIDLSPVGMVATDFAAIIEKIAGPPRR